MTLTETAIEWLESKKLEIGANSLSDVVERLARQNVDKKEDLSSSGQKLANSSYPLSTLLISSSSIAASLAPKSIVS